MPKFSIYVVVDASLTYAKYAGNFATSSTHLVHLGPLVRRLQGYELLKLVAGPWADVSQDLHGLLRTFAEQRVEALARLAGRDSFSVEGELGKAMGEVRRALSIVIVQSNALCLLECLSQLGPGARRAG